jgi:hypothetical protein
LVDQNLEGMLDTSNWSYVDLGYSLEIYLWKNTLKKISTKCKRLLCPLVCKRNIAMEGEETYIRLKSLKMINERINHTVIGCCPGKSLEG